MILAQGNGRAKPDGFLHLNNHAHVPASGLAGCLYERVMTEKQQALVELTLIELCNGDENLYHFKHNVWRFRKDALAMFFKGAVYSVYRAIKRSPATEVSMAISREELGVDSVSLARPAFR